MIRIPELTWERVVQHCLAAVPDEACGYLAAVRDVEEAITDAIPVLNVAEDAHARYEVDEREQLAVWASLDEQHKRPVVTYHSHVGAPVTMSPVDVDLARDSRMLHLILSVVPGRGVTNAALWRVEYTAGVPVVVRQQFEVDEKAPVTGEKPQPSPPGKES